MILKTKCTWSDCGQNIEFDESQINTECLCPSCNREIKLAVNNSSTPMGIPIAVRLHSNNNNVSIACNYTNGDALQSLRGNTHYKTTRIFIEIIRYFFYVNAAFLVIGYLASFIASSGDVSSNTALTIINFVNSGAFQFFIVAWGVLICLFLGSLWKETASLLVDIADVQMSVYKNNHRD